MQVLHYETGSPPGRIYARSGRALDRFARAEPGRRNVAKHWTPAVDVREEADCYVILVEVPGVDPSAIDVTLEHGVLSIKGERGAPETSDSRRYLRSERAFGAFHRSFSVPESVDAGSVTAAGRQGVLEITIPRQPKVQDRRIQVN